MLFTVIQSIIIVGFMTYLLYQQETKNLDTEERLTNLVIHTSSILSTGAETEDRKLKATEELIDIMREVASELHANRTGSKN